MSTQLSPHHLKTLSTCFLFKNVDEILMEQLCTDPRCEQISYPRGATIFDEAHFRRCLGILLTGEVLVEKNTADGKRLNMTRLTPGECFGAAAMYTQQQRYASLLTAKRPTQILYLPQAVITWAMERSFTITENYITYLSGRIWFLSSRISALTAGTAQQKLAVYLIEQGDVAISMTDLSQQLNLGRASLYRAVEELEESGAILRAGKMLKVLREDVLRDVLTHISRDKTPAD